MSETDDRRIIRLHRAVIAALAVSLALGLFTPLYSDEIGWRFQLARSVFDGGVDRYIAPGCRSPMIAAPWFLQPLRWASAWGNALLPWPAAVRWFGVGMAVAIVAAVALAVRRAGGGRALGTLALGALGLGLLPFLLVWSRPEQPILLCVVLAVAIGLGTAPDARRLWGACGLIVLLGVVALGYHLKAIFYLPVFLAALWTVMPGVRGWRMRGAASAVLTAAAVSAYRYWSVRFLCPGDATIDAIHRAENLGATLAAPEAHLTWGLIGRAVAGAGPGGYVAQVLPGWVHMSDWIAPSRMPDAVVAMWRAGVSAGWMVVLFAGLAALAVGAVAAWRARRSDARLVLAGALAVSLLGWSIAQLNDNAYESMLWLPLSALAAVLTLSRFARAKHVGWLATAIGCLAVASQALLWVDYARLIPASRAAGFVPGQAYSINPYGYDAAAIRAAGRKCGIAADAPRVVVDDWTYLAYQRSYRPLYAIGVFGRWQGAIADPVAYLRTQRSPGVVAACSSLPAALRNGVRRSGQLCCFSVR